MRLNFKILRPMDSIQLIIQNAITQLSHQIKNCSLPEQEKAAVVERIHAIDILLLERVCNMSLRPLTIVNLSYIICFLARLSTPTIAIIFKVEPATVYTARYRLRAYFNPKVMLPF